jgi:hypothetical protein
LYSQPYFRDTKHYKQKHQEWIWTSLTLQTITRGTTLSTIPVLLTLLNFSAAQKVQQIIK